MSVPLSVVFVRALSLLLVVSVVLFVCVSLDVPDVVPVTAFVCVPLSVVVSVVLLVVVAVLFAVVLISPLFVTVLERSSVRVSLVEFVCLSRSEKSVPS